MASAGQHQQQAEDQTDRVGAQHAAQIKRGASPDPPDPCLEERREFALAVHEVRERSADLRREHGLRMVPGHRKIPISEHAIGGRAKLGREAAVIVRELLVRGVFRPGVLVGEVERLLVRFENVGHRGG